MIWKASGANPNKRRTERADTDLKVEPCQRTLIVGVPDDDMKRRQLAFQLECDELPDTDYIAVKCEDPVTLRDVRDALEYKFDVFSCIY